jgi:glutaredoxin 3
MFILYYKPSCPFCQRVLQMATTFGVTFELKDISEDESLAEELVARGGKRMVPYLVDTVHH